MTIKFYPDDDVAPERSCLYCKFAENNGSRLFCPVMNVFIPWDNANWYACEHWQEMEGKKIKT